MDKQEIIQEYLDTIKVQKVDLKFSYSPSRVKGRKKSVPMDLLAGVDSEARRRLNTKFKILSRGFDIDAELEELGLKANFLEYCAHEDAVKQDNLYTVDYIGTVILSEDIERFRKRVQELQVEAEKLQVKLTIMLRDKVQGFARELYHALVDVWGGADPEWWLVYRKENPLDTRAREDVFCDRVYREIESVLELKKPDFWVLFTRFNPDIAGDSKVRKAFKSAFRQYLRTGSGRDLDWLIGRDPNDRQGTLF